VNSPVVWCINSTCLLLREGLGLKSLEILVVDYLVEKHFNRDLSALVIYIKVLLRV